MGYTTTFAFVRDRLHSRPHLISSSTHRTDLLLPVQFTLFRYHATGHRGRLYPRCIRISHGVKCNLCLRQTFMHIYRNHSNDTFIFILVGCIRDCREEPLQEGTSKSGTVIPKLMRRGCSRAVESTFGLTANTPITSSTEHSVSYRKVASKTPGSLYVALAQYDVVPVL